MKFGVSFTVDKKLLGDVLEALHLAGVDDNLSVVPLDEPKSPSPKSVPKEQATPKRRGKSVKPQVGRGEFTACVMEFFEKNTGLQSATSDITAWVASRGFNPKSLASALNRLEHGGRIRKVAQGVYSGVA